MPTSVSGPHVPAATAQRLAVRMNDLSSSPTLGVLLAAERLRQQGADVVDMGAGEPDFFTPPHVKLAAQQAIESNFTKYTPNAGILSLKQAICARLREDYGVEYSADEVIVSAGGKQALYNAALALFGPGDEVITHAPLWPTLTEQIKLAGAKPVLVRTHSEDGFTIHAEAILAAVTPSTRAVIVNSPSNPTGALISEADMTAIADDAAARGYWVIVDSCYDRLIYDSTPHNLPGILVERLRDRTVLAGSTSKTYAMTGWRCGWALGPRDLIAACNAIQSHSTSNVCSITQKAAVAALTGPQDSVTAMLDEYRVRRDRLCEWLSAEPRIKCVKPSGAFYLFLDISELLSPDAVRTSAEFAQTLLAQKLVALTAGEAFEAPGFLRISYAAAQDRLREGVRRLRELIEELDRKRGA